MLSHFLRASTSARVTYISANTSSTTGVSTYTFTSQSLGTAFNDRTVFVAIATTGGSPTVTHNSLTVGGVSATKLVTAESTGQTVSIYGVRYPTGTTANIVLTINVTNAAGCSLAVYSASGVKNLTANSSVSYVASKTASNLNLTATGSGFAIGYMADDLSTGASWTGLTTDVNSLAGPANSWRASASANFFTSGTKTISATFTGGSGAIAAFATLYIV